METVGERLTYLIEKEGVSVRNFCMQNKISYNSFNQITLNNRNLGINVLRQIVEAIPNVNANWLLFGMGSAYTTNYVDNNSNLELAEPNEKYVSDPVEKTFLEYLQRPNVAKLIEETVKKIIKDGK